VYVARDRDKYERELVAARRRLEETLAVTQRLRDEAKDRAHFAEQMMGIVSHDLRNPLSVIHMSAALLERGVPPPQQHAAVARVTRAVQRVQHLIGDLLDFTQARLGSGLGIRKARVDLHQAIADSVAELAVAFPDCMLRHEHSGEGACLADAAANTSCQREELVPSSVGERTAKWCDRDRCRQGNLRRGVPRRVSEPNLKSRDDHAGRAVGIHDDDEGNVEGRNLRAASIADGLREHRR